MDFDDNDDQEEENSVRPVGSSNESPSRNSGVGLSGGELGRSSGRGGDGAVAAASTALTTGHGGNWKAFGGGGSGGRYRECLKNHAVGIGGHAVDGCGEFMAAGEEGTLDALKCAACNCHRNFHRKETDGSGGLGGMMGMEGPGGFHQHFSPYYRIPTGYLQHHHTATQHIRPSLLPLALPSTSGAGGGGHSREDQEDMSNPMITVSGGGGGTSSGGREGKKRFRTKFSQEQKDKMLAFAENLGWRIQKHDEAAVQQFCAETNVKRHVLKVWMHNNKHTLGKKP